MDLREKITRTLAAHGVFHPEMADDIAQLVTGEMADDADTLVGAVFTAALRRRIEHNAALLRIVTPETLAEPQFRGTMSTRLSSIAKDLK
jgi:hypothetical protein